LKPDLDSDEIQIVSRRYVPGSIISFSTCSIVKWKVSFHGDFEADFDAFDEAVQDDLLAHANYWSTLDHNSAGPGWTH